MKFTQLALSVLSVASVSTAFCMFRPEIAQETAPFNMDRPVGDFMCNHEELWLHQYANGTIVLMDMDNNVIQVVPLDSQFGQSVVSENLAQTSDENEIYWAAV